MDHRRINLGEVVDRVLHGAAHDVLDLIGQPSDGTTVDRHAYEH
jgi:hypothetical protein